MNNLINDLVNKSVDGKASPMAQTVSGAINNLLTRQTLTIGVQLLQGEEQKVAKQALDALNTIHGWIPEQGS